MVQTKRDICQPFRIYNVMILREAQKSACKSWWKSFSDLKDNVYKLIGISIVMYKSNMNSYDC